MGLINEKENYEDLIHFLKNKLEKNEENFSKENFSLSKKIINDYEKLNEYNNLTKNKNINYSIYNINLVFDNQNVNQKIERIKKWINMSQNNQENYSNFLINKVKTNKSLNNNYKHKFLTKSNDINSYLKQKSSNVPENKKINFKSIENKQFLFQTPNKKEKKSFYDKNSNTFNNNDSLEKINITNYTDSKIEIGLNNYYKKKKDQIFKQSF